MVVLVVVVVAVVIGAFVVMSVVLVMVVVVAIVVVVVWWRWWWWWGWGLWRQPMAFRFGNDLFSLKLPKTLDHMNKKKTCPHVYDSL